MRRTPSATSGFSLIEALIALAIAAFLAAVVTRFVSSTRANALHIRQEVSMDILGDALLESLGSSELQPGRSDGRSGVLRWHVDIAPMTFSAYALSISEKKPASSGNPANGLTAPSTASAGGLGLTAGSSTAGSSSVPGWIAGLISPPNSNQAVAAQPQFVWTPYHVTAVVTSPSGRTHAVDTIRVVGQRQNQPSTGTAKP